MNNLVVVGEAMRRHTEELERSRRRTRSRSPVDLHRELLDLYRVEAKVAVERAIAAEDKLRWAAKLTRGS